MPTDDELRACLINIYATAAAKAEAEAEGGPHVQHQAGLLEVYRTAEVRSLKAVVEAVEHEVGSSVNEATDGDEQARLFLLGESLTGRVRAELGNDEPAARAEPTRYTHAELYRFGEAAGRAFQEGYDSGLAPDDDGPELSDDGAVERAALQDETGTDPPWKTEDTP